MPGIVLSLVSGLQACDLSPSASANLQEPRRRGALAAWTRSSPPPTAFPGLGSARRASTLAPLLVVGHQPLWSQSRRELVYLLLQSLIRSNHNCLLVLTSPPPALCIPCRLANSAPLWMQGAAQEPAEKEAAQKEGQVGWASVSEKSRGAAGRRDLPWDPGSSFRRNGQHTVFPRSQPQAATVSPTKQFATS